MEFPRWNRRLLDSTRGQVILLLREKPRTVADLAAALGVTDNAIRVHLATFERDGLLHQHGEQAGLRKPHFSGKLTKEADELFPKVYAPVLTQLLVVLKEEFGGRRTEALLAEVGRRLVPASPQNDGPTLEDRRERAVQSPSSFGGQASITRENGKVIIGSTGCPFSAATAEHPEVCQMVTTLLSDLTGLPVRCACQQKLGPWCRFEIEIASGDGTTDPS